MKCAIWFGFWDDVVLDKDTIYGRDADLLIVVNSQIPTNDLIVHFL